MHNYDKLFSEIIKNTNYMGGDLTEELFTYITTVTPMVNIDLLIKNDNNQYLLSWRDDGEGIGWHIPGGIIRYKETIESRIQKVAINELGAPVICDQNPIKIVQSISNCKIRGHFISLLFLGRFVDAKYDIDLFNAGKSQNTAGYLKWFTNCPSEIIPAHRKIYGEYL